VNRLLTTLGAVLLLASGARAQGAPPPNVACDSTGCHTVPLGDLGIDTNPVSPAMNTAPQMLDLTNGATSDLLDRTLTLAREFWLLCFVIALVWEAFGNSPTEAKDFAAVLYRSIMVLLLLVAYRPIFGTVINVTQEVADRIAPADAHEKYAVAMQAAFASIYDAQGAQAATAANNGGAVSDQLAARLGSWQRTIAGGLLYNGVLGLLLQLGGAVHWVLRMFAAILCALFYIIGPLALVFSMPRISGVGSKWFGHFVTVATWPIFSALLLAITLQLGLNGLYGAEGFGAMAASLVMILTAIATPILAGKLIGGSPSVVGHGAAMASNIANKGIAAVRHLAGGDKRGTTEAGGAGGGTPRNLSAGPTGGVPPVNPPGSSGGSPPWNPPPPTPPATPDPLAGLRSVREAARNQPRSNTDESWLPYDGGGPEGGGATAPGRGQPHPASEPSPQAALPATTPRP